MGIVDVISGCVEVTSVCSDAFYVGVNVYVMCACDVTRCVDVVSVGRVGCRVLVSCWGLLAFVY